MIAALRKLTNGHAKPNGKCEIDEVLEAHARAAREVIEAVRERRNGKKEDVEANDA